MMPGIDRKKLRAAFLHVHVGQQGSWRWKNGPRSWNRVHIRGSMEMLAEAMCAPGNPTQAPMCCPAGQRGRHEIRRSAPQ